MGLIACMGEMRSEYKILVRMPKGRDHLEDLDVDGRIVLKCILEKWVWMVWTGSVWLRTGSSGRLLRT
jgi:hypothetical protein